MAKHAQSNRSPIWGVVLLFIGVVFLLQTLNIIPWGLWGRLWRFWPVLIIIVGLVILFRHTNSWVLSVVILVLLFGTLALAVWQYHPTVGSASYRFTALLAQTERAQVRIDFNAGRLSLRSLDSDSGNLIEASSESSGIIGDLQRQDREARLSLSQARTGELTKAESWEIGLARRVPVNLNLEAAATDADIDLSELNVPELDVKANAGEYRVILGVVNSRGNITGNAANLSVTIPKSLPARIKADVNLGSLDIDQGRFPRQGDFYVSPDFDSATNRLELSISVNFGRVELR